MDDGDGAAHDPAPEPADQLPQFGTSAQARRGLRTALWIVGVVVVVSGLVVVGLGILFAVGISQWAANK